VLVTEFAEGAGFSDVRLRDEPTRDRVAEIVHRFYYDTANRTGLACGDPHPGNFLLAPDGRVAFLDFGMVRQLPHGYLAREGDVYRAIRAGDRAALRAVLDGLGYIPPDWRFENDLLYEHMRRAGSWMFDDPQPRRLGADASHAIMESLFELGPRWREMVRSFSLPSEALLLRRMENIVFGVCADLRACADWRALSDELVAGEATSTALGREHAAWLSAR
jgi:predicted unusual protein kinase regulating ubiquinone biosynthesis (AarF/ABC1/UbiB family)